MHAVDAALDLICALHTVTAFITRPSHGAGMVQYLYSALASPARYCAAFIQRPASPARDEGFRSEGPQGCSLWSRQQTNPAPSKVAACRLVGSSVSTSRYDGKLRFLLGTASILGRSPFVSVVELSDPRSSDWSSSTSPSDSEIDPVEELPSRLSLDQSLSDDANRSVSSRRLTSDSLQTEAPSETREPQDTSSPVDGQKTLAALVHDRTPESVDHWGWGLDLLVQVEPKRRQNCRSFARPSILQDEPNHLPMQ